jgi:hypothetical protein
LIVKPLRKIEMHPQGIVVLSPDDQGRIKRDVEDAPKPGDWHYAQDGFTKMVRDERGGWIEAEPPTLDELLAAEEERRLLLMMAKPLSGALDSCVRALMPEHGTAILTIFAEGTAESERSLSFQLPRKTDTDPRLSCLTHEDSLTILATVRDVIEKRLAAIKTKLNAR